MPNQGVAPLDYTTAVGQVRLLIGDTDPDAVDTNAGTGTYTFYADGEIEGLLSIYGADPRRTAAQMLRTIAITPALLLKKFQSADVMVDGPAVTEALLATAKAIEDGIVAQAADWVSIVRTGGRARPYYDPLLDAEFYQNADNRITLDVEQGILP